MKCHIPHPVTLAALIVLSMAACGKESKPEPSSTAPAAPAATENVAATGKIIEVEAYSDAEGNYFKPASIEAHQGDVIRFVLKSGVHNVNFLPDSNPGKAGLPATSEMMQLPGQTYDLKVTLAKGKYFFQCDPHAALGMIGRLEVED